MGDASGLVRVRVLAQGKTVISGMLFPEERRNKVPSDLIRVRIKEGRHCRGDRAGVELGVRVHRTKTHGLATRNWALMGKSGAQKADKGQISR
jgi:hypothetical protein